MSLINDALKKAQRERAHPADSTPIATPPAATPPPTRPAAPRQEFRSKGNPWLLILVVVGVVGGGTAVWFLKPAPGQPGPQVASNSPTQSAAPVEEAPPVTHQPATEAAPSTPATEMPQLSIKLPGNTASEPTPPPAPSEPAPPPNVATQQPASPPPVAAPANPAPLQITLQLEDPRILAFLDAAKINGIRAAADDAKLLMNNKVFRVGNVVDRELGLKLVQILPTELVFEDSRGIQYRKIL